MHLTIFQSWGNWGHEGQRVWSRWLSGKANRAWCGFLKSVLHGTVWFQFLKFFSWKMQTWSIMFFRAMLQGMWNLSFPIGIKPKTLQLKEQRLNHWTARVVSGSIIHSEFHSFKGYIVISASNLANFIRFSKRGCASGYSQRHQHSFCQ